MSDELSVLDDELTHDPARVAVRYQDPLSTITHVCAPCRGTRKIAALAHIPCHRGARYGDCIFDTKRMQISSRSGCGMKAFGRK